MPTWGRWLLAVLVGVVAVGGPLAYYRTVYENYRRFRAVTPDRVYRAGQLTAHGFEQVVKLHGIKTVINLQEENRDPFMPVVWAGPSDVRESELCGRLGVKYFSLHGGEVVPEPQAVAGVRPKVIDEYLQILDDPANYPVLLHCKAGLHRTGLLTAVYRMEFEHWSPARATQELRANGFGTFAATTGNVYLVQYIERYKAGVRNPVPTPKAGVAHLPPDVKRP
jgi:tyrosine-protein phosphatase SIW14